MVDQPFESTCKMHLANVAQHATMTQDVFCDIFADCFRSLRNIEGALSDGDVCILYLCELQGFLSCFAGLLTPDE